MGFKTAVSVCLALKIVIKNCCLIFHTVYYRIKVYLATLDEIETPEIKFLGPLQQFFYSHY